MAKRSSSRRVRDVKLTMTKFIKLWHQGANMLTWVSTRDSGELQILEKPSLSQKSPDHRPGLILFKVFRHMSRALTGAKPCLLIHLAPMFPTHVWLHARCCIEDYRMLERFPILISVVLKLFAYWSWLGIERPICATPAM